ncbi:ankyrin repeat domain-containing protein [Alteromonas sp. C1M14]|uniref:ankyrin repeat domain-containing protein n=1 Tax=Alteromonas sp. C1M14 TaxID=2841567 RepID=UPI001C09B479|nr:ankyrin repeat domain-containing protein [Alteromonas sp. C1M14]MBU2979696.1 ankyrin repeat domain-containing protein [Alteromonas sp. C1M14]
MLNIAFPVLVTTATRALQRPFISQLARLMLFSCFITTAIGCKSASDDSPLPGQLTNLQHDQLVLKAKEAILNLDLKLLTSLTDQIDVNRLLADKSSLLAWAVETQEPEFVNVLLKKGAYVQLAKHNRFSPIIEACRYGNSDIINALLDRGADITRSVDDGTSALHLCAASSSLAELVRISKEGADISEANDYGQTPLMFAANAGNVDNLNYLVQQGAKINRQSHQGYSPLFFAIKSGSLKAVKAALANGANIFATTKDGTTAAQLAVYSKNYVFLTWYVNNLDELMTPLEAKSLLTAFDRDGYQLLHAAVKANEKELVIALLAKGAKATTVSAPSKLKWRYEANFKTQEYVPPQLTPIEIAEKHNFNDMVSLLRSTSA